MDSTQALMDTAREIANPYIKEAITLSAGVLRACREWVHIQLSYGVPEDTLWSVAVGVVVAVGIFTFGNKQLSPEEKLERMNALEEEDKTESLRQAGSLRQERKEPKKKGDKEGKGGSDLIGSDEKTTKDLTLDEMLYPQVEMNEEQILKKTEKMRKIFGASDEDTREAIRKAQDQQRRGLSAAEVEMEEPFVKNAVWVLEKLMLVACIMGGIWSLNIMTQGDVGRMIVGIFPREMELLGLKEYFQSFGALNADAGTVAPRSVIGSS